MNALLDSLTKYVTATSSIKKYYVSLIIWILFKFWLGTVSSCRFLCLHNATHILLIFMYGRSAINMRNWSSINDSRSCSVIDGAYSSIWSKYENVNLYYTFVLPKKTKSSLEIDSISPSYKYFNGFLTTKATNHSNNQTRW